jgi:hypothetical protein
LLLLALVVCTAGFVGRRLRLAVIGFVVFLLLLLPVQLAALVVASRFNRLLNFFLVSWSFLAFFGMFMKILLSDVLDFGEGFGKYFGDLVNLTSTILTASISLCALIMSTVDKNIAEI